MVSRGLAGWGLAALAGLSACDSAPVKACHAEMQSSQRALLEMDKTDAASVTATLGLIEATLTTCKQAGRGEEVSDLADARRQVAAHLSALEKRADQPTRTKLTPEALAALVKAGDPDCPRGQGYEPAGSKQIVKCTGPQLAELGSAKARDYFDKRGYRLTPPDAAGGFKAEFGASAYVFRYAEGNAMGPPRCLEVTGRPGTPWQEIVARLSGVHPDRLQLNEPVRVGPRTVPLRVSGDPQQWSVQLGECASPPAGP